MIGYKKYIKFKKKYIYIDTELIILYTKCSIYEYH